MISMLRNYWKARPFVPFKIHLADGRALPVPHPEFFFMSSKGGQIFVAHESDDDVDLLNPLIIVSIARIQELGAGDGSGQSDALEATLA